MHLTVFIGVRQYDPRRALFSPQKCQTPRISLLVVFLTARRPGPCPTPARRPVRQPAKVNFPRVEEPYRFGGCSRRRRRRRVFQVRLLNNNMNIVVADTFYTIIQLINLVPKEGIQIVCARR